jgi:hypothetical protein
MLPPNTQLSLLKVRILHQYICVYFLDLALPPLTTEYMKVRDEALKFWDTGDSAAPWIAFTEEDMVPTFSTNREPLPEGGVQKRPPLVKSGSC